jgi:hypothetical protein
MEIARRSRLHAACGARIDLLFTMSDNTCARRSRIESARIEILTNEFLLSRQPSGGARRDRTDDLLLAKQALSQLSYGPFRDQASVVSHQNSESNAHAAFRLLIPDYWFLELVGLGRFELPTSRLSSARSNQLSYKPEPGVSGQKPAIGTDLIAEY